MTATVGGGSGYRVSTSSQGGATVSVADNDDGGASVLSVADGRAREGEDWLMPFTVRLSPPAAHAVEVTVSTRASKPVSARASKCGQAGTTGQWTRAGVPSGETERTVQVVVYDNSHDEGEATFEVVLSAAKGQPLPMEWRWE
ncbi:MAG: hypothetical protein OXC96_01295 [Cyanobacteria bacterium MAG CAR1_bin_15]|nr:hypothetical protein [Cyanobacteria bacterium MAG CAR1_bin_15]